MKCNLCEGKNKQLRNSHIIPETLYEFLYDDIHRFNVITNSDEDKCRFEQQGFREKLLCDTCEQKISVWEKKIKTDIMNIKNIVKNQKNTDNPLISKEIYFDATHKFFEIKNINYKEFKLGLLSILWRLSLSKLRQFENYSLGPHEKILQKMFIDNDEKEIFTYGFTITHLIFNGEYRDGLIMPMGKCRIEGHNCCSIILAGIHFCIYISNHNIPLWIKNNLIATYERFNVFEMEAEKFGIFDGLESLKDRNDFNKLQKKQ